MLRKLKHFVLLCSLSALSLLGPNLLNAQDLLTWTQSLHYLLPIPTTLETSQSHSAMSNPIFLDSALPEHRVQLASAGFQYKGLKNTNEYFSLSSSIGNIRFSVYSNKQQLRFQQDELKVSLLQHDVNAGLAYAWKTLQVSVGTRKNSLKWHLTPHWSFSVSHEKQPQQLHFSYLFLQDSADIEHSVIRYQVDKLSRSNNKQPNWSLQCAVDQQSRKQALSWCSQTQLQLSWEELTMQLQWLQQVKPMLVQLNDYVALNVSTQASINQYSLALSTSKQRWLLQQSHIDLDAQAQLQVLNPLIALSMGWQQEDYRSRVHLQQWHIAWLQQWGRQQSTIETEFAMSQLQISDLLYQHQQTSNADEHMQLLVNRETANSRYHFAFVRLGWRAKWQNLLMINRLQQTIPLDQLTLSDQSNETGETSSKSQLGQGLWWQSSLTWQW